MLNHVQAGDAEIIIPFAGTVLCKYSYSGPTEKILEDCIAKWAKRFGGPQPKLTEAVTRESFIQGCSAFIVTKRNKRSFRFAIIPTPMTIVTIEEMKDMEIHH